MAVVVEQVTYTVLQRLAAGVHDIDAVAALVVVRNRSGHNVTVSLSDAVRHEDGDIFAGNRVASLVHLTGHLVLLHQQLHPIVLILDFEGNVGKFRNFHVCHKNPAPDFRVPSCRFPVAIWYLQYRTVLDVTLFFESLLKVSFWKTPIKGFVLE